MRLAVSRTVALSAALLLAAFHHSLSQTRWVGTWAAAPSSEKYDAGELPTSITLREIVHVSRGGDQVRITITNELGTDPLTVGGAHLSVHTQDSGISQGSDRPLAFGGQPGVIIPPGALAVSDPVAMPLAPTSDLAITLLLPPQPLHTVTAHSLGLQTNYEADGDQLGSVTLTAPRTFEQWRFLKNVEVSGAGSAIVTLGDSITDGHKSTANTNRRWPDVLAQRLQADKRLRGLGVLNEGISGNRLLHNGAGPNALARFDRDVLSQSGVRYLILLEGINDIGSTARPHNPGDAVTTQQIIVAYEQMIARAHTHDIKVFGATLTPFLGAGYATPAAEEMRQAINAWIRTSDQFDGVIDFDKLTRDPAQPGVFAKQNDSGDHLHPGDTGYTNMGEGIDLKLFRHQVRSGG